MTSFWKTKKGILLQACIVINVLVVVFIEPPILYYSPYTLSTFVIIFLVISLPVSISIKHNKKVNRPVLKYIVVFLILSFFFGWPYLRLTALVATYIPGYSAEEQFTLIGYKDVVGRNRSSCSEVILLKSINLEHRVCAEKFRLKKFVITNITEPELWSLRKNNPIDATVRINNFLGISVVTEIQKI